MCWKQSLNKLQHFVHLIVSDLVWLWQDEIQIATLSCPQDECSWIIWTWTYKSYWSIGWLICVSLVAVVCNSSAAHKIRRSGSCYAIYFCAKCQISQADKEKPAAYAAQDSCLIINAYTTLTVHLTVKQGHFCNAPMQSSRDLSMNICRRLQQTHAKLLCVTSLQGGQSSFGFHTLILYNRL